MKNTDVKENIEKSSEWDLAWKIINDTDTNLFITGKAGTGKTTFLRYLKAHTDKRMIVLAPTGIAAINARGVTIHSFFQLPFSPFLPGIAIETQSRYRFGKDKLKIIRSADLIVIDEISMVRADLLDAVDDALKRLRRSHKPFGGVQMLMIGDLQQLAPVVKDAEWSMLSQYYESPYFFDSNALKQTEYATVELKKVFRQDDEHFISILNSIRGNTADDKTLAELNKRYIPDFVPKAEEGYIRLTTHNALAQAINKKELDALKGQLYSFRAEIEGNYPEYSYPTDEKLSLKLGAQVMFVKNDTSANKLYYNGMIGEVCSINTNGFCVRSKESRQTIEVSREKWQNCKYSIDTESNEIKEQVDGTFSQFPVKLAWAITIHKSQGLTFRHAIIDVHSSFAHGQTYVALSRCKSLDGLVLSAPVTQQAIISDQKVETYTKDLGKHTPTGSDIERMEKRFLVNTISELFNFCAIETALAAITRLLDEHLYKAYPRTLVEFKSLYVPFRERVSDVATRFHAQYTRLIADGEATECGTDLKERIKKGAGYFMKEIAPIGQLLTRTHLETNNKQIKKMLDNATENLRDAINFKTKMLNYAESNDFSVASYLKAKAAVLLGKNVSKKNEARARQKIDVEDNNLHPTLLNELVAWRTQKMRQEGIPAYCVFSQKAIMGISNIMPTDINSLIQIPGIGKAKADKYGVEVISIVKRYKNEHE